MTHLSFRFPIISTSLVSCLKRLGYISIALICIGCTGSSSRDLHTVSIADLRAQLQPLKRVGVYAGFDLKAHVLYMGNDSIERWLRLDQGGDKIRTIHYARKPSGQSYIDRASEEFRFRIGEIVFSGNSDLLTYKDYQIVQKIGGTKRVTIQFTYASGEATEPIFYLWIHYEIYPDLPLIRKWLTVQNLTDSAFFVEDVTIESLPLFAGTADNVQIWRCGISGALEEPLPIPWEGGTSEAFILVGDTGIDRCVVLGNESAGLLKHYAVYSERETVSIGLMPTTAINGTEIRVPPGQSVNSPKVWTMLVEGGLQATIEQIIQNPLVYVPPYSKGVELQTLETRWITLEAEWEESIGLIYPGDWIALDYDWNIEYLQTVKRISQRVHEGGGKFGIRLPIAEIHTAVLDRPDWRLVPIFQGRAVPEGNDTEEEGQQGGAEAQQSTTHEADPSPPLGPPASRGKEVQQSTTHEADPSPPLGPPASRGKEVQQPTTHEADPVIYCVLSDYGYYLTQAVKTLLEETEADLLILDRPILGSQSNLLKGCDALGHQHYTRAESIRVIYRWLFEFADHLHREYPALQLGITASAYGVKQPDAACLAHFDLFFDP